MGFVETSSKYPAIVAGDLNATEDSPQILAMSKHWIDSYRAANPEDAGLTCCISDLGSDASEPLEKRIDYLFLAPGNDSALGIKSSQRIFDQPYSVPWGWQWASDHVGIMSTVSTENLD